MIVETELGREPPSNMKTETELGRESQKWLLIIEKYEFCEE